VQIGEFFRMLDERRFNCLSMEGPLSMLTTAQLFLDSFARFSNLCEPNFDFSGTAF